METHAVFLNMAATGHVNPTLPLAGELRARGAKVTYFVAEPVRAVVEAAGATWRSFQDVKDLSAEQMEHYVPPDASKEDYGFPISTLVITAWCLPKFLEELKALEPPPSVLLYDPFIPMGLVAARVLGIPCVSTLTMTGPGVIQLNPVVQKKWESSPVARKAWQEIKDGYGVDVFEHGTMMEFYSPDLNLVSTSPSLYVGPTTPMQLERFAHFPFECVGPLLNPKLQRLDGRLGTTSNRVKLLEGKKKLYISPGTVATGYFWTNKFGPQAGKNGMDEQTGKDFVQMLLRSVIEALRDMDVQVIISTGGQEDALEGLPCLPEHWLAEASLPQLELLPQMDAFITHGGANSIHEALSFAVPMAVVPIFGDQPQNAEVVERLGCGVSFAKPLETLNVEALRQAVEALLRGDFAARTAEISEELQRQGGARGAAEQVLRLAERVASPKLGGA